MKLSYSKKILIVSIIVFVIILILDIIFTNLLMGKIISINDKVKQLDLSSREREMELSLRDSVLSTKLEREKLAEYFVGAGNAEVVEFTKYLEDLAQANGVIQKKTLNYEPVSELANSENVSTVRFRFTVSGKWSNVFNFLQAIENLPKITYLNSVSLNLQANDSSAGSIKSVNKIWSADLDFSVIKLK